MIDTTKLKEEQLKLARKVVLKDGFDKISLIAGSDQAYYMDKIISAIAVLSYEDLKVVELKYTVQECKFPYIPTYLSYRESPAIVETYHKLDNQPDIILVDGNGILHPRKLGVASHLGLLLDKPTIGVAKSLLLGEEKDGKIFVDGEPRAFIVTTREYAKPIYVSPGHLVSMGKSLEIVKHCLQGHKLPEPLKIAHNYANKIKRKLKEENPQ
jgi:deoxyribonuclease V